MKKTYPFLFLILLFVTNSCNVYNFTGTGKIDAKTFQVNFFPNNAELIEPGILPENLFKHIKYTYVGKYEEGVLKTDDYPIEQFRYADIFELRLETDAQKEAIKSLVNNSFLKRFSMIS